jgi:DNA-binding NtrC family response regulator
MSHDVFLCCAPANKALARVVCASLQRQGLPCWLAARDLSEDGAGQPEAILDAIGRCRIFLLLLSRASRKSESVIQEVREALRARKEVVALKVTKLRAGKALRLLLHGSYHVDASKRPISDHLGGLVGLLKSILEKVDSLGRQPARARGYRVLVVEDNENQRLSLAMVLELHDFDVTTAATGEEALLKTERIPCDIALLDLRLPGMNGIDLLAQLKARQPDLEVLMVTGDRTIQSAIAAMRQGAYDYLTKPIDPEELSILLHKVSEKIQLARRERQWLEQADSASPRQRLVGSSPQMQRVQYLIEKVASADCTILVCGESGTGKELASRVLHRNSPRCQRPFIILHCAGQETLALERELFGHEERTFSGAYHVRRGLIETAEGGTLFIDEVAEMPSGVQAKLLRFLEDRRHCRVGSIAERHADVRVIAATERNLAEEVRSDRFREDLYYRLNVVSLDLPPLRERLQDVAALVDHLLDTSRIRSPRCQVSPEAMEALHHYPWPGNVRELANVLERAQILADDRVITPDELPEDLVKGPAVAVPLTRPAKPRPQAESAPPPFDGLGGVLVAELRQLQTEAPDLAADLVILERLMPEDIPGSLNKIRYLTERILHQLCSQQHVSWGKDEPTLGSMIGPLIFSGCVPRNMSIHVRTIQTIASPGSHFQVSALSERHLAIALAALIPFLQWARESRPSAGSTPLSVPPSSR